MEPSQTTALPGHFGKDSPSRTNQSHLLLRKEEIRPNTRPKILYNFICEVDQHAKLC